eukprot:TRINITY_DN26649_c0_g1_i1.p1 TRINITY_DN26649_c0_g1~~TRINITY_DN26649_c0_g1_i1.p1  ORF type:complete len:591 (+),score=207.84 TRINITY_DN26649_c0_g1_i1:45-1817(+)
MLSGCSEGGRPVPDTDQLVWDAEVCGRGWARLYVNSCLTRRCRVNSLVLDQLKEHDRAAANDAGWRPPPTLDLTRAYVGRAGVEAILPVVCVWESLVHLSLAGCGLDSRAASRVVATCLRLPKLSSVDLSCNPLYASGGAAVLRLLRVNRGVTAVDLSGTQVPEAAVKRIHALLLRNKEALPPSPEALPSRPQTASPVPAQVSCVDLVGGWEAGTEAILRHVDAAPSLRRALERWVGSFGRVAVFWVMEWGGRKACEWLRRLAPPVLSPTALLSTIAEWRSTFAAELAAQRPPILSMQLDSLQKLLVDGRNGPRPKRWRYPTADAEIASLLCHCRRSFQLIAAHSDRICTLVDRITDRVEAWVSADFRTARRLPFLCDQARYALCEHGRPMAAHVEEWQRLGLGDDAGGCGREAMAFGDVVGLVRSCQDGYAAAAAATPHRLPGEYAGLEKRREIMKLMDSTLPDVVLDWLLSDALFSTLPRAQMIQEPPACVMAPLSRCSPDDVLSRLCDWGQGCAEAPRPGRVREGIAAVACWLRLQPVSALESYARGERPALPPCDDVLEWVACLRASAGSRCGPGLDALLAAEPLC